MNNQLSHPRPESSSIGQPTGHAPCRPKGNRLIVGLACVLPLTIAAVWLFNGSTAQATSSRKVDPSISSIAVGSSDDSSFDTITFSEAAETFVDVTPSPQLADAVAKEQSTAENPAPVGKAVQIKPEQGGGIKGLDDLTKRLAQSNPGLRVEDKGYAPPNVLSKIQALDGAFPPGKIDWATLFTTLNKNVTPDSYTDKDVIIPLVIGIRMCDGVMAIRLKNAEWLKECGDDIEALAKTLDVPDNELAYARAMKDEATKGNWLAVFENLGILQKRVTVRLQKASEQTSTLVMIGGWMQGARFIGTAVQNLKDTTTVPSPSYVLREPKLVEWLLAKLKVVKTSNDQQKTLLATVQKELASILKIVSIDIDPTKGKIEPDQLALLISGSTAIVDAAVGK